MTSYAKHFSVAPHQTRAASANQRPNNAGGYAFALDRWARLDRWLILGCEGGTYDSTERQMTLDNAQVVVECLAEDGVRAVEHIAALGASGRAPRNAPAIFALAIAAGASDLATRRAALAALPRVCRTGTELFYFAREVEVFRRWGRGLRNAVAAWYNDKPVEEVAYQAMKYQQCDGWSHRDLLRLAHPTPPTPQHEALYRWITGGREGLDDTSGRKRPLAAAELPALIRAFEVLRATKDKKELLALVREHRFTHEVLPSAWKNDPDVWEALLEDMPPTALLRNLGKMTAVGVLASMSHAAKLVAQRLTDAERLRKARVHPIALLSALTVYAQGHGERAQTRDHALRWTPVREVLDALDEAFYLAFRSLQPTGRSHLLALDVSSSMTCGGVSGIPGLTPRVASAAMAMATARVEPDYAVFGFTAATQGQLGGSGSGFWPIPVSPRQRLDDVLGAVEDLPFGATDCSLPMRWARANRVVVDTFVVYTDNETWAGHVHPFQALEDYRQAMGRPSKLIVVGMTATAFSIANPADPGMLDVVGFDAAAPQVMADFARG